MTIKPNLAIQCDTFSLLERVSDKSIDLVYLDPPWVFHEIEKEDYYEFIFKVIQQSYRCLKDTGSLFFYSNPDLNTDFHLLIKKIFDARNFVTEFIIPRKTLVVRKNSLGQVHDTVILYTKTENHSLNFRIKKTSADSLKNIFPFKDNKGRYRTESAFSHGDRSALTFKWKGVEPHLGQHWKFSKDRLDKLFEEGFISMQLGNQRYRLKTYYKEDDAYMPIGTIWDDISSFDKSANYSGVQSEELLDRIIEIGTKQGDFILDPFFGSGTSLVVALKKERKVIGCDNSPAGYAVLQQRLEYNKLLNNIRLENKGDLKTYPIVNDDYLKLNPTEDDKLFDLILKGESDILEFKESLCWNFNTNKSDKSLVDNVIKSIAAFLNNSGGTVLIGIRNDMSFLDLKIDFEDADPGKRDKDGYELFLNNKIKDLLGSEAIGKCKISFHILNDCEICKIVVANSKSPIFFNKNFYVRNNNQSVKLSVDEFYSFIKSRDLL